MTKPKPKPKLQHATPDELLPVLAVPQLAIPRLWPCFIGPTGCGKTARAIAYAARIGRRFVAPPLTQGLPEDFTGLPRVDKNGYGWHFPEWARVAAAEPCLLFFDEIDKASEDHQKVLLPVLHELEIHGKPLHPESIILCAMQRPSDSWRATETGNALLARMIPLKLAHSAAYLSNKFGVDLHDLKFPDYEINLEQTPQARGVEWLLGFAGREGRPEYQYSVAHALFGSLGSMIIDRYNQRMPTVENILAMLNKDPRAVHRLTIAELANLGAVAMFTLGCPAYEELRVRLRTEGTLEDDLRFAKDQENEKKRRQGPDSQPIELFPGFSEDDVTRMINNIARRSGEYWLEKQKEGET
jgi:hypothetical protein